jgi:protein translocase SEC61 complex gamma subunit
MAKKLAMKLKSNYHQYVRVWKLLKRPTTEEFLTISKVSAVGLLVIGALGFVISVVMKAFV